VLAVVPRDRRDLAASRARHPSVTTGHEPDRLGFPLSRCDACGYADATPTNAVAAVRRVTDLALRLLAAAPTGHALERVARLRDELHATANRVDRIRSDQNAAVPPVRVHASTAATPELAPAQLRYQLNLTTSRLRALLDEVAPLHRPGTAGAGQEATTTIASLLNGVLHGATHDLIDLLAATAASSRV
jgi:hypothetical protein